MTPKIIKNEKDYKAALAPIDDLMDADPDTPEGDELDLLVTLVELYEKAAYPIDTISSQDSRFRCESSDQSCDSCRSYSNRKEEL